MEDRHSFGSPRRILSFSERRRATVSFSDPDNIASRFGVSGEHGLKPTEVYGFIGSITTIVATVNFLIWAYVPQLWLHSIGISYCPSRHWALTLPVYVMLTMVLAMGFYLGLNFMASPLPSSSHAIYGIDEFSREPSCFAPPMEGDELPIEPISDIGIDRINSIMFNHAKCTSI